jgi:hypothetical protein
MSYDSRRKEKNVSTATANWRGLKSLNAKIEHQNRLNMVGYFVKPNHIQTKPDIWIWIHDHNHYFL